MVELSVIGIWGGMALAGLVGLFIIYELWTGKIHEDENKGT
jgi:hypothetical protein